MQPDASMKTRNRILVAALLLFVALFLWSEPHDRPTATTMAIEASSRVAARQPATRTASTPIRASAPIAPALRAGDPKPPIIDEVIVEKPEVCEGEENLITVRAHSPDQQDDAYLHYLIDGSVGMQVPIRSYRADPSLPPVPAKQILVFGRNNVAAMIELPQIRVKDCRPADSLLVSYRAMTNAEAEFSFAARLTPSVKPFAPVRYEWRFGDGESKSTSVPTVEHRFRQREQALYSNFLISCEAKNAAGETVLGRTALQLLNSEFENFNYKGIVVLSYDLTPRFPHADASGRVTQQIRLWHQRPETIHLQSIFRSRIPSGGRDPEPEERLDPASVLGTSDIPPDGVEATLRFDTSHDKDIAMMTYRAVGETSDGYPVVANFSIMKPPDLPTRDSSTPVVDPVFIAKIKKTRELLKQEFVTDEDILRLEDQGAFANLRVDPTDGPGAPLIPPNLPKPPRSQGAIDRALWMGTPSDGQSPSATDNQDEAASSQGNK